MVLTMFQVLDHYFWKKNMTMKKQIVIPLFMLCAAVANAQKPDNGFLLSGSVIYQQIAKLNIKLEGDGAAFADALPKEPKSEKILHFSEKESLYENYDTGETDDPIWLLQGNFEETGYHLSGGIPRNAGINHLNLILGSTLCQ